ncbi:hypothetical protein PGTUg99_019038 [Puccinia graminis f. sp. tritici]|uniref:Uncharacterized protein n=1 Tax=Puccinia graminis f. sp. tritici TaxID=56615 RepID=A0A5B0Q156_PUCGR|nr:hypothetical protein PGTUg99_019038 [Puccinia graminis f. sp. tritici]
MAADQLALLGSTAPEAHQRLKAHKQSCRQTVIDSSPCAGAGFAPRIILPVVLPHSPPRQGSHRSITYKQIQQLLPKPMH